MSAKVAATAIVYPGVVLGEGCVVEDFCIIGAPPAGRTVEECKPTMIGPGAVIRSHTTIYAGNAIGRNFQTGNKANIREDNQIGDDVSIGTLSVVEHHCVIEDGARLHTQVFVPEYSRIGRRAWLGPNVVLTNARYPASPLTKHKLVGVVVEPQARIGANVTVLPGVMIGRGCLVGAGSVVTRDVPPGVVAFGNPATVHRPLKDIRDYDEEDPVC